MLIIGCDFHTRYQQIAMMDEATGERIERRLDHESGEAQAFYRNLQGPVRVGIEATGPIRWFERFQAELGHELWMGDSAKIRASEVRKQKTDERDVMFILDLLLAKRSPKIWVPTPAKRDLRQLLWHRHKLVCLRTMLGNQLHALAMSEGLCRKKKLFTKKGRVELIHLGLAPWASRRREELLKLLDQLEPGIAELDRAVMEEANRREDALLLMTHPGIGPVTSTRFNRVQQAGRKRFNKNHLETTGFHRFQQALSPGSGPGGRWFKSTRPDHFFQLDKRIGDRSKSPLWFQSRCSTTNPAQTNQI